MNRRNRLTFAAVGLVIVISPTACSSSPEQPATTSSTTIAASTRTSESAPPSAQEGSAETIVIGTSGARCFVGQMTVACATMERKGMYADGKRLFSFVRTKNQQAGMEPGFAPGQHVTNIATGDLILMNPGNCDLPNTSQSDCVPFTIAAAVDAANSKDVTVGIIAKVSTAGMTIFSDDTRFDIPIPPPAEAGRAVYRANAGQQLNSGQSTHVRDWSFTFNDKTLTINGPTGVTIVEV